MLAVGIPAAPAATAPPAASAAPLSGEGGFASLIAEGEALAAEEGAAQSVESVCQIKGRPHSGRYCFGVGAPMREPDPAAGTRA